LAEGPAGYEWWQTGIIYQVYPRSFMDSNDDGVGDLDGITSKLDYLRWLGVNAIWISPIFPSPMADFGYDVSDYTGIHPLFGTMEAFERLVKDAHGRGIRVILDFVPNHSSDEHPWFVESRTSRANPKRDWYIWRQARPGGAPPNNWLSHFGGSAWTWDEQTRQYYYHAFLEKQPDLNWRNPRVQVAMMDALRFWLSRGVDGFRVDVIWELIKDQQFRDNPTNPAYEEGKVRPYLQLLPMHNADQPEVHDLVRMMRGVLDEYGERALIGEIYLPLDRLVKYYGEQGPECHLPYNFSLVTLPWEAKRVARAIEKYERALPDGAWPNWVLGNHDVSRIATRAGPAQRWVAAMLLLTLRGTPTMYYGDEIGMENVQVPENAQQDPVGKNLGYEFSRDPSRTPMRWDSRENAGFSAAKPWLPVGKDSGNANVAAQSEDPDSLLSLYRRLIALRQSEPALSIGSYRGLEAEGDVLAYLREEGATRFLLVLNLGSKAATFEVPEDVGKGLVALATDRGRQGEEVGGEVELRGDEGVVVRLGVNS
jgi:alpha-glucosidase